jgi:hypothetical protein
VNIVLQSGGIIVGIFLILSTLIPEFKQRVSGVDIYIFISGLVVCAVSAEALKRDLFTGDARKLGAPPAAAPAPQMAAAVAGAEIARIASGGPDRIG